MKQKMILSREQSEKKSQENALKICQQQYIHKVIKLFRLCETDRANLFISAT